MKFIDLIDETKIILWNLLDEGLQPLLEFALPARKIEKRIENLTPDTMLHLYKIIAFGEEYPLVVHHWCAELGAWLSNFCTLLCKSTNKPLPVNRIMKCIKMVYSDITEFKTLGGGKLYSEYGYSKLDEETIFNSCMKVLPHLIIYIQSLKRAERPDPNKIAEIINQNK